MKLNVVFVTEGLTINGRTDREKALGGSETALICVAREMVKLGHYVRVYCNCDLEGIYDSVVYYNVKTAFKEFITHSECDVLIVSRHYQYLAQHKVNSKLNILWNHDILTDIKPLIASLWQFDYMYTLSEYHEKQYIEKIPELDSSFMKRIYNGIDTEILPDLREVKKDHRIMFTSRPERGLFQALEMFERYGDLDLSLLICNYETINDPAVVEIEKICSAKIVQLQERGFKIRVDRFNKRDLYMHMARSKAVLYPTQFPEIFCISALEAQACGTVFITTDDFALPEIVPYERCKFIDDGQPKFMTMLAKVLRMDDYRKDLEKQGLKNASNYGWQYVASSFINDAMVYFQKRSEDRKGIIERLIYDSDLLVAKRIMDIKYAHVIKEGYEGEFDLNVLRRQIDYDLRFVDGRQSYTEIYNRKEHFETCGYTELVKVPRMQWPSKQVKKFDVKNILSYGCHNGAAEILISNENPDCLVYGYDISENIIIEANKLKKENAEYPTNILFSTEMPPKEHLYGAIYIGEVLEHVLEPEKLIQKLEEYVKPGGKIFITLPRGAWEWLSHEQNVKQDIVFHVHSFDWWDIQDMFNHRNDFQLEAYHDNNSLGYYQECVGNYLISYTKEAEGTEICSTPIKKYNRKMLLSRPYQSITACIIARNAEHTIEKLLESIHFEMDEIIIGIDHNEGEALEFIKRIEKYYKVKWFYLPKRIVSDSYGFAAARNDTVARATSKWIFWIDTDEELLKVDKFRKYLDTPYFNSFNILQQHPQLDNFIEADKPQRLFRKGTGTFVGYIHEQVQDNADINKGVDPSIILSDCHILNFGELHEGMRRNKAMGRNLELLEVDVKENVDNRLKEGLIIRYMSIILLMRDFINRIIYSIERFDTPQNKDTQQLSLPKIKQLYNKFFADIPDEDDSYYKNMAYKMVERAMELAEDGTPIEIKIGKKTLSRRVDDEGLEKIEKLLKVI